MKPSGIRRWLVAVRVTGRRPALSQRWMVLTDTPNARPASPADRNSFFFIFLFYCIMSIFVNAFWRSKFVQQHHALAIGNGDTGKNYMHASTAVFPAKSGTE